MSISALFITDLKGKVVISRNYRGDVSLTAVEKFAKHLQEDDESELRPIITDDNCTFVYIRHNNLYLMAMTQLNINVLMVLNFLSCFVQVFEDYFNELNEESIRDNFVLTYELFDEMMDFGYPQSTEPKILKEFICVSDRHRYERAISQPPPNVDVLTGQCSRGSGDKIQYKKNEVFLDVVEKVNLLVASNGAVIKSEVIGTLKLKTYLSGIPELKLGLNDKILFEQQLAQNPNPNPNQQRLKKNAVEMEDIHFHQCVSLARFDNDRTISFVPPDGDCDLMQYRLTTPVRPLIAVEANVQRFAHSRIEYTIRTRSNFKKRSAAKNVNICIPVPPDADSPNFKASIGNVSYVAEKDSIIWHINNFPGQSEFLMRASFGLPSTAAEENLNNKTPITVQFEIPYFTVSGIQVRYLKIIEKSGYQALPWVRYITQNGDYQIRMS